jgi:hypothetical protein
MAENTQTTKVIVTPPDLLAHVYNQNGAAALLVNHDLKINELERRGA